MVISLTNRASKALKITGNLMIRRYNPITAVRRHPFESETDAQLVASQQTKIAVIIGANPTGLATAYELLRRTNIIPILLEETGAVGGFAEDSSAIDINNRKGTIKRQELNNRHKYSIYFQHKFLALPLKFSFDTFKKLGFGKTIGILASYLKAHLFPKKPEQNLEEVLINRFGYTFYDFLLRDYFDKAYGIPCNKLPAIMNLDSIFNDTEFTESAIYKDGLFKQNNSTNLSLGLLWNEVARRIEIMGGKIFLNSKVDKIYSENSNTISSLSIHDAANKSRLLSGDYFIHSAPINGLIENSNNDTSLNIKEVGKPHLYCYTLTVWVLVRRLSFRDVKTGEWKPLDLEDDYIYIHDKNVKVGRLRLSNNWSSYTNHDSKNIRIGMDFICPKGDLLWQMEDKMVSQLAVNELTNLGFIAQDNVLDAHICRIEKASYISDGCCDKFFDVRKHETDYKNLYFIGNKIHNSYASTTNALIPAITTVDKICNGNNENRNIWEKFV